MVSKKAEQIPLAHLAIGQRGKLVKIDGGKKMTRRLEVLGIRPGKEICMASVVFNNGPVIVNLDGRLIAIGRGQAQKIYIERIWGD